MDLAGIREARSEAEWESQGQLLGGRKHDDAQVLSRGMHPPWVCNGLEWRYRQRLFLKSSYFTFALRG